MDKTLNILHKMSIIQRSYTCTSSQLRHTIDVGKQREIIRNSAKEFEDDLVRLNFDGNELTEKYILKIPDTPWALHINPGKSERYTVELA